MFLKLQHVNFQKNKLKIVMKRNLEHSITQRSHDSLS